MDSIIVFVESGKRKTFVGATDWPGWIRWGKDESAAISSLLDYGDRYAGVLNSGGIQFQPPETAAYFQVLERHKGNATTDFGAHDIILDCDSEPVNQVDLQRWLNILQASWNAFDRAAIEAQGKVLRKGPRGGGRDLEKIMVHVLQADQAYLRRIAWRVSKMDGHTVSDQMDRTRGMILQALHSAVENGLPGKGPRGGVIWPLRFFIRRVIWHILDHTWEIEDRLPAGMRSI